MPYLRPIDAGNFNLILDELSLAPPTNPGELNYLFTKIALLYFNTQGGRYQQINDILGALQGASNEFYRRVAVPYENKKMIENGDVY
jgi:hypothetical protein